MSKEIDDLATHLAKILTSIDCGTVNVHQITEVFNDHIDRIMQLEKRLTMLENEVKNQQIDTVPGAI